MSRMTGLRRVVLIFRAQAILPESESESSLLFILGITMPEEGRSRGRGVVNNVTIHPVLLSSVAFRFPPLLLLFLLCHGYAKLLLDSIKAELTAEKCTMVVSRPAVKLVSNP